LHRGLAQLRKRMNEQELALARKRTAKTTKK